MLRTILLVLCITSLALTSCSPAEVSPTPTAINIGDIQTQVAATIFAGETSTALARPTNTSTPTLTPTTTATITPTSTLTQIVYVNPVLPVYTAFPTTTGTPGTLIPSPSATLGAVGCNNAALVTDVTIPNNTKINAGETFTKTWRIKNTGTCKWTFNFKFTFVGGHVFNSDTTKIRRNVGPGTTTDFSLTMVAPSSPGSYSSSWEMADESGKLFGAVFTFVINVPGATFTPSPPTETSIPPTTYP